ncbi:MAG TPA: ABC transporter substrate-binding protein [Acetobacteraceae bacterium]|nr:ABC transporter substrate-binding protein [Acetobacteraceae bacterium]
MSVRRCARGVRLLAAAALSAFLATAASAQTLTIGVRAGPESIDPHFTATGTHAEALKHIFDTLVWSGDQLQLEPRLAESWRPIGPTTWEFRLRRGVRFHDGSEFTAEDVKFSIERMPMVSGPNPTTIYVRQVREVRIVDPHTVHIETHQPAPTLPNDFVRVFVVSHRAAAGLTRENANAAFNAGRAAVGTGPYRFVSWTPREELVLERFDGFWGEREPWQRVVRREIPNDSARVAQLRAGQVDMIVRVPAADVPTLERDQRLLTVRAPTIYVFNMDFDFRERSPQVFARDGSPLPQNPLRDARVREAFDLAMDRQALAEVAMEGMGRPEGQMVTQGIFGFIPDYPILRPNLQRARQLLTEAGYPNGFRVQLSFSIDRLPGDRQVGLAIVQMLARIGIDAQANGQPITVVFPARTRGEYSMTMLGWGTLTGEAHYTYSSLGHTNDRATGLGAFNWRGYSNPQLDDVLQRAGRELDDARRTALLHEAGRLYLSERISIPLVSVGTAWSMRRDRVRMIRTRSDEDTLAMDLRPPAR